MVDDNRHMSFPWLAKTKIPNGLAKAVDDKSRVKILSVNSERNGVEW